MFTQFIYYHILHLYDCSYAWKLREKYHNSTGIKKKIHALQYMRIQKSLGSDISLYTVFEGIPEFPHGMTGIFTSRNAVIGSGCTIFQQVTIGSNTLSNTKYPGSPVIGDNTYIGAGAKIIGGIQIGKNVRIGANCVVTFDVPDNATVVSGRARIIEHSETRNNQFCPITEFEKQ